MSYYVTSIIHLHLEDLYNNGLKPENAKEIIENMIDPASPTCLNLRCESSGINHNWNVRTLATDSETIDYIVDMIYYNLKEHMSIENYSYSEILIKNYNIDKTISDYKIYEIIYQDLEITKNDVISKDLFEDINIIFGEIKERIKNV